MKTEIISTLKCSEYGFLSHPEKPQRIKNSYEFLHSKGEFIFSDIEKLVSENDILLAHTKKLYEEVKTGKFYEPDTPAIENIYDYALLSINGAITALEHCLDYKKVTFSLMRPPGHHAKKDSLGGFCYFNNIAIAVKRFLKNNAKKKVSIIDIDCHHGNGTQDIFLGEQNVLFISLHQVPLYPGTGLESEKNCLNFPLPPGTEEEKYLNTLKIAIDKVKKFAPDLIGVSAGFDTYKLDPLTQLNLGKNTYYKIAELISSLNKPRFAVLEGGYSKDLPECIYNFLLGFSI